MLGHNPTQMDSYNKTTSGKGTLIANWFEERVHRETKGEGRTMTRTHIPKRNADLMESTGGISKQNEDTKYRILGDHNAPINRTENYHYGKGRNPADNIPKTGRKQQLLEQMYLQQVSEEVQNQQRQSEEEARKGQFTTTHRDTFVPKPLTENKIGKLVMYDQSGRTVDLECVDEELRCTNKFKEREQITETEELLKLTDTNLGYERQQPITFWKEKIEDGQFYMSETGGDQPFSKNNNFLKTFMHYKHNKD